MTALEHLSKMASRFLSFAWLISAVSALIVLAAPDAHADSVKVQCIQANTEAQTLRREGKLAAAREQLRACSEAKCPSLVSVDCIKRLDELESAQPTVIFDVFDVSGHEVNDVAVSVDGHRLVEKLEGAAVAVDLGEHQVTFAPEGRPSVTQKLMFREGEKSRHVRITVDNAPGTPSPGVSATPAAAPAASEAPAAGTSPDNHEFAAPTAADGSSGRSQRTIGYLVGGAGLAGLGAGGLFGYLAIAAKHRQIDDCSSATQCSSFKAASDAHDIAKRDGLISTVAFIAGGAATVTGLVLVLTAAPSERSAAAAGRARGASESGTWRGWFGVAPQVAAGGGAVELLGAW